MKRKEATMAEKRKAAGAAEAPKAAGPAEGEIVRPKPVETEPAGAPEGDEEGVDLGEMGSDAGRLVAQGVALMKMESDRMSMVAIRRPRDPEKVLERALSEVAMSPADAKTNWYVLPFKNHVPGPHDRKSCNCPVKNVEGASVVAARTLKRLWGNCVVASRLLARDADSAKVQAVFLDYETNDQTSREWDVSLKKTYWNRSLGKRVSEPLKADDIQKVINGAISRAERTVILNSLPKYLVSKYLGKARDVDMAHVRSGGESGGKKLSLDEMRNLAADSFHSFGVTLERIEKFIGRPKSAWTEKDLGTLRGIWNALDDKELSPSNCFAEEAAPAGGEEPSAEAGKVAGAPDAAKLFDEEIRQAEAEQAEDAKRKGAGK